MKQFLIIQTAFLGDVILCTPVISELKRIYPEASIDVVVRKGNEGLLKNNPKIRKIIIWDKKNGKYKSLLKTISEIRQEKYTEVINLQRYFSAALMCLRARSTAKTGFDKNVLGIIYSKKIVHDLEKGEHEVERNLKTIAHHGAKPLIRPELFPSKEDFEKVNIYKKEDYYCLAPASVWETKKLPYKKWLELIDLIKNKGRIYLIGGAADIELCSSLKKDSRTEIVNLAGKLGLLESAALMRDAKMNFVNDSGPLHLSSAMNAPTRAFFCSTVEKFGFGPLSEDGKIVEIDYDLYCRPCGIHGYKKCPEGHFKCGEEIKIHSDILH
ncbi:MAG: glycosyltransferase family 9 protein [Brumimicrobium sp.]|nr:glycosyltransferase family 9 protein [Brumimicrobium sp.]